MSEPAFPPPALRQIAQDVSKLLKEQGATVSVAETAAGGLISAALLSMPGASKYYNGGVTVSLPPAAFGHPLIRRNDVVITEYQMLR